MSRDKEKLVFVTNSGSFFELFTVKKEHFNSLQIMQEESLKTQTTMKKLAYQSWRQKSKPDYLIDLPLGHSISINAQSQTSEEWSSPKWQEVIDLFLTE